MNVALSDATSQRHPSPTSSGPLDLEQAEAALVEHYPRLVRLAYLVLPPGQGRHRRVLTAHSLVQRALPRSRADGAHVPLPAQRGASAAAGTADTDGSDGTDGSFDAPAHAYAYVRLKVLRSALAGGRRRFGRRSRRTAPPRAGLFPLVFGLRLFPRSGGADELALEQALSEVSGAARAAFVLRGLEGMADADVCRTLAAAKVAAPEQALAEADGLRTPAHARGAAGTVGAVAADRAMLGSPEFDPCSLQARPTDLLRRRQHTRAALAGLAAVVVCGVLLGLPGDSWGPDGAAAPAYARNPAAEKALDPAALTRAAPGAWRTAPRTDFSTWPARGRLTGDRALLRRALAVWARPGREVRVSATHGTPAGPPAGPPHLLYAGRLDGAHVVLLYDGLRVARYAEPAGADSGSAVLDLARVDGADATGASALVVSRNPRTVRYLTAPWVRRAAGANLLRPADEGRPLHRDKDGVTEPLTGPRPGRAGCDRWPGMLLTPSGGAPHLFTDLGELAPARLTAGAPGAGTGSAGGSGGSGADATGPAARAALARTACDMRQLSGGGVREVNTWQFAEQRLPEGRGAASWACLRAETWRGTGAVALGAFLPPSREPDEPAALTARTAHTAACGPHRPRVLTGVQWRSKSGHWYLLAAGSRDVAAVRARASGGSGDHGNGAAAGNTLAVRTERGLRSHVTARLANGARLHPLR